MLPSWFEPDVFAVLVLGAVGPLLGLAALFTRAAARRADFWWAFAAAAFGGAALAARIAGLPHGLWLPAAGLAGLCGVFQALRSDRLARAAAALLRAARRPAVHAAVLIVTGPVLAAGWMEWTVWDATPGEFTPDSPAAAQRPIAPDPSLRATTDAGRPVPLYRRTESAPPSAALRDVRRAAVVASRLDEGLIRTGEASDDCNCHGWVFTGGRAWIIGADVPAILHDNGYSLVTDPRPGDLVVYRGPDGMIAHSGVVRAAGAGGPVLVESKWGAGGRFVSAATFTAYGDPVYYRSPRRGHLLRGFDAPDYRRDGNAAGGGE